jgi:hypothetical protein
MAPQATIAAATGRRCRFVAQQKATISSAHGARGGHGGPEDQSGSPPHRGRRSVPQPAAPVHVRVSVSRDAKTVPRGGRRGPCGATSPVRFKPPPSSASLGTTAPARRHAPSTEVQISALIRARPQRCLRPASRQDRHHLLFGESGLLHGSLMSPRVPFSQVSTGPKIARQVRTCPSKTSPERWRI